MATRYSGDVEVRVQPKSDRVYAISVRGITERGRLVRWKTEKWVFLDPSPAKFDRMAQWAIQEAEKSLGLRFRTERDKRGIAIRRVYQAPCPS